MISMTSFAQSQVFNEKADSRKEISDAITKAKTAGKNVFIMIGGNWSPWSKLFQDFSFKTPEVHKALNDNYVKVCLSARENKDILIEYGSPNRLGFPVFCILNSDGKLIHTQDSGLLEEGDGYDKQKVVDFMLKWTVSANK